MLVRGGQKERKKIDREVDRPKENERQKKCHRKSTPEKVSQKEHAHVSR